MFSKENNKIQFTEPGDLLKCSAFISNNSLADNDETDLHENYSLSILLIAQSLLKLHFPFNVEKHYINDPPDFLITYEEPSYEVGLEHVIATIENYQMASKEMKKNQNIEWLESSYYTFEKKIPKNRSFIGLKRKGDGFSGDPLFGDFHITNWVKIVLDAIKKNLKTSLSGIILLQIQKS